MLGLCKHCISGVIHGGEAQGKFETINGVECYVGTPTRDYSREKALLVLTDALGNHIHTQLLVDAFARNGFYTVSPDYLNGDPAPNDILATEDPVKRREIINSWITQHTPKETRPPLDRVIAGLKERGVNKFGATGYCFGGKYVLDLAIDNLTSISIASHPSYVQISDFHTYFEKSKTPLLLNTCEIDDQFPFEQQRAADQILGTFSAGYMRKYWEGCHHGFAVRGDVKDPKVRAGLDGSFRATVAWLRRFL